MKGFRMGPKGLLIATAAIAIAIGISSPGRADAMSVGVVDSIYYTHDVGSETNSQLWKDLGRTKARIAVPFDIAERPSSDMWRQRFDRWIWGVVASGAEPYVTFMTDNPPNWGGLSDTYNAAYVGKNPTTAQLISADDAAGSGHCIRLSSGDTRCHMPDLTTYSRGVDAFVRAYSGVHMIGAWNEPDIPYVGNGSDPGSDSRRYYTPGGQYMYCSTNHNTSACGAPGNIACPATPNPDNCGPDLAAHYWAITKFEQAAVNGCGPPRCITVAGEFYGGAPVTDSNQVNYGFWGEYEKYLRQMGLQPYVWATHPFGDSKGSVQHGVTGQASLILNGWLGGAHFLGPNTGATSNSSFYRTNELPKDPTTGLYPKSHLWLSSGEVEYKGDEFAQANTLANWLDASSKLNSGGQGSTVNTVGRVPRAYVYNYENCYVCGTDYGVTYHGQPRFAYYVIRGEPK